MLAVISPAKNLDFGAPARAYDLTEPAFLTEANRLARTVARLPRHQIQSMMDLSDDLADLNWRRFKAFSPEPARETVKQAALAFNGDTYQGLAFATLDDASVERAQARLCILSGLYGLLRPLDAIQPYRLEMGRRVQTRRGATLYDYWGDRIARALNARAEESGAGAVVNLASIEYFGAVDRKRLALPVLSPRFEEEKGGQRKVISFFAKRARGSMARWMMETGAERAEDLPAFDRDGYVHDPATSTPDQPVFVRKAP